MDVIELLKRRSFALSSQEYFAYFLTEISRPSFRNLAQEDSQLLRQQQQQVTQQAFILQFTARTFCSCLKSIYKMRLIFEKLKSRRWPSPCESVSG